MMVYENGVSSLHFGGIGFILCFSDEGVTPLLRLQYVDVIEMVFGIISGSYHGRLPSLSSHDLEASLLWAFSQYTW